MRGSNSWSIKNESGAGLIEILIAAGLISAGLLSILSMVFQLSADSNSSSKHFQIDLFRRKLIAAVLNNKSWEKTYSAPDNGMGCLTGQTAACGVSSPALFALRDGAGKTIYDGRVQDEGFTTLGTRCTGFHPESARNECYYRFDLTWSAVCPPAAPCVRPLVMVNANLRVAANSPIRLNAKRYSISKMYRSAR